ncbi:hypothetical protein DPEC_G00223380 [Dallia pectoralis]|uniref:Uncharacterized protein n=1 Tax=Dallia pectoralis TaxID=75939 RepID=A0ACC2FZL0_DALPE|nr:hypothetical protein DPEC_G00223380 [Dallia pectoralis]
MKPVEPHTDASKGVLEPYLGAASCASPAKGQVHPTRTLSGEMEEYYASEADAREARPRRQTRPHNISMITRSAMGTIDRTFRHTIA